MNAARPPHLGLKAAWLTGTLWALLAARLAADGHAPSGPLFLPIPREDYYARQALFAIPAYLAMFYVFSGVMHGVARAFRGSGGWTDTTAVAGVTMAASSLLGWWLPDAVAYAVAGFSALPKVLRFAVPGSAIMAWFLGTAGLRMLHNLSTGRALLAVVTAWVAQVAVSAPFLR